MVQLFGIGVTGCWSPFDKRQHLIIFAAFCDTRTKIDSNVGIIISQQGACFPRHEIRTWQDHSFTSDHFQVILYLCIARRTDTAWNKTQFSLTKVPFLPVIHTEAIFCLKPSCRPWNPLEPSISLGSFYIPEIFIMLILACLYWLLSFFKDTWKILDHLVFRRPATVELQMWKSMGSRARSMWSGIRVQQVVVSRVERRRPCPIRVPMKASWRSGSTTRRRIPTPIPTVTVITLLKSPKLAPATVTTAVLLNTPTKHSSSLTAAPKRRKPKKFATMVPKIWASTGPEADTRATNVARIMQRPPTSPATSRLTGPWTANRRRNALIAIRSTCQCQHFPCTYWHMSFVTCAPYAIKVSPDLGYCKATWGPILGKNLMGVPTVARPLLTGLTWELICKLTQHSSILNASVATNLLPSNLTSTNITNLPASKTWNEDATTRWQEAIWRKSL